MIVQIWGRLNDSSAWANWPCMYFSGLMQRGLCQEELAASVRGVNGYESGQLHYIPSQTNFLKKCLYIRLIFLLIQRCFHIL